MGKLADTGRVFYGIALTAMGIQTITDQDFPYMLIPQGHDWINGHLVVVDVSGGLLILAGLLLIAGWYIKIISLFLGTLLGLIFCFYFVPYEFLFSPAYRSFGDWENAAKELALAGGAFAVCRRFCLPTNYPASRFWEKLMAAGLVFFPLAIISFGLDHLLYANYAQAYIPAWIPWHLFWIYLTGTALVCSGIAIIFRIRPRLFATLLGSMIFIWILILHIPKVMAAPVDERAGELTSALIALAYCGTAYIFSELTYPSDQRLTGTI